MYINYDIHVHVVIHTTVMYVLPLIIHDTLT